jgi:hypothetical protein
LEAEDYDTLIADPSDYFRTTLLLRRGTALAPRAGLDSFVNIMDASMMSVNVLPFANPAVLEGMQRPAQAAGESFRWLMTLGAANADAGARLRTGKGRKVQAFRFFLALCRLTSPQPLDRLP